MAMSLRTLAIALAYIALVVAVVGDARIAAAIALVALITGHGGAALAYFVDRMKRPRRRANAPGPDTEGLSFDADRSYDAQDRDDRGPRDNRGA